MEYIVAVANLLPPVSPKLFGQIAGALEILGHIPYLIAILRKTTIPSRATWWIWTLAGMVTAGSYYASGARDTLWQPLAAAWGNFLFAILSLRYGTGGASKTDILCGIGAIASLFVWYISNNPVIALVCILMVGSFGIIPTLQKAYINPNSEDVTTWATWWVCNFLNMLALTRWSFALAIYPVYNIIELTILLGIIFRGKILLKMSKSL